LIGEGYRFPVRFFSEDSKEQWTKKKKVQVRGILGVGVA